RGRRARGVGRGRRGRGLLGEGGAADGGEPGGQDGRRQPARSECGAHMDPLQVLESSEDASVGVLRGRGSRAARGRLKAKLFYEFFATSADARPAPGADGGTRTRTWSPKADFKSAASTGSATSARRMRPLSGARRPGSRPPRAVDLGAA